MFDQLEPLHTKIEKVINLKTGNIVLENPAKFPLKESNLYYRKENGDIGWYAEKPAPNTLYNRVKLNDDGQTLSAYTTDMHACELEVGTGKLLSKIAFE